MPIEVSVHEAKTNLSRLLNDVEAGEQVVIRRHGKAIAQIVAIPKSTPFPFGAMAGEFSVVDGWDKPLTDEEADAFWEGKW